MYNGSKIFYSYGEALLFEDKKFQLGFNTHILEGKNGKFEVVWF